MKQKRKVSAFFLLSLLVLLFVGSVYLLAESTAPFADYINDGVAQDFRRFMAGIGDTFGFSVFEVFIFSIPLIILLTVLFARRALYRGEGIRFILNFTAVIMLIISGHLLALGIGYRTTEISEKMELAEVEITEERLIEITERLVEEVNSLADLVPRSEGGVFTSDYSHDKISSLICDSYDRLAVEYGFAQGYYSRAKWFKCGAIMSYLGISGIYTYPSGEANVNSSYPSYVQIFSAAHEMCHQRGILRENEANFVAYLITSTSSDLSLRYSGALNMFEYFASAVFKTNKEAYYSLAESLSESAWNDIRESNRVYKKYSDTFIERLSNKINNLYLQSNGTEGVVSYGKVVQLVVAYYE
jgi:hypothetical protein